MIENISVDKVREFDDSMKCNALLENETKQLSKEELEKITQITGHTHDERKNFFRGLQFELNQRCSQLIFLSEAKINYLAKNPDCHEIVNEFCMFANTLCFGLEQRVQQADKEGADKIFEEILSTFKQRYYELAKQYHPDKNTDSESEKNKEIFQAIN